jgi:diphthamide biosynthesis protein 4
MASSASAASVAGTHYSLLGVSSKCTAAELASAFRSRALQLHPDKQRAVGSNQSAIHSSSSSSFLQLQQAYSVLRHDESRQQYDAALKACGMFMSSKSAGGASFSMAVTEVDLDDLAFDDADAIYSYQCRCGAALSVAESDLLVGVDVYPCQQCSLVVRILYEWQPIEEEAEEMRKQQQQATQSHPVDLESPE